jgi:EAL domain-containing protein (putative c-di-GMP-specific phosphodiesterase class I)
MNGSACEQAAAWPGAVKVAVNISPLQFKSDDLISTVRACLAQSGLPPNRLELEITEAAVLQQSPHAQALFAQLHEMGITIAFDDFGTGYSSLSSQLRLPFDKLKIDRSFLSVVDTSPSALAIVRATANLGETLNLITTGEGVETREQLAVLRRCGCSEAQGSLFSLPRPNSEVPRLLDLLERNAANMAGTIET